MSGRAGVAPLVQVTATPEAGSCSDAPGRTSIRQPRTTSACTASLESLGAVITTALPNSTSAGLATHLNANRGMTLLPA